MSNMSYVRFQNTLADLQDCQSNFDADLSGSEFSARNRMLAICKDIVDNYGDATFVESCTECGFSMPRCRCDEDGDDL